MGYPGDFLYRPQRGQSRHAPTSGASPERLFNWVPIRSLAKRHRRRVLGHLLALNETDRYLRFGYAASDEQIRAYVERIDFQRDEVFGVFNRRLALIAMVHLAYLHTGGQPSTRAEFGVSVSPHARGRGYGARLFEHAVLHARNRGVDTLIVQALSENAAMLRIARNAGAVVARQGSESEAVLKLPPDDIASRVGELIEDGAAELDYGLKLQARRMRSLLEMVADLRANLGKSGHAGES